MTRLEKELRKHGLVYEYEPEEQYGACEALVEITDKFIITLFGCDVLPSEFHIYDRNTYEMIGGQDMRKTTTFFGKTETFNSYGCIYEEDGVDTECGREPFAK